MREKAAEVKKIRQITLVAKNQDVSSLFDSKGRNVILSQVVECEGKKQVASLKRDKADADVRNSKKPRISPEKHLSLR